MLTSAYSGLIAADARNVRYIKERRGEMSKKMLVTIVVFALVFLVVGTYAQIQKVSVETMPPSVVKTVPQCGDTQVDPDLKEIKVTFSKDMMDGSWSWSQISNETFPQISEKPYYLEDKRTCVAKVKLEPEKTYIIWLNSAKFGNFKDKNGRSAVPYLLVFQTRVSEEQ